MTPSSSPVYVINLDRSRNRLAQISSALAAAGMEFKRVPAVDVSEGYEVSDAASYDAEANRMQHLAPLSPREVACFASHRRAWQIFLSTTERPAAVFLEDDAIPQGTGSALQEIDQWLAGSASPELIKLYCPPSARWRFRKQTRWTILPPLGAVAYAMNRPAARTLLGFTQTFFEPVDVALQRWWDHGVRVSVSCPPLFVEARGPSTIRHAGDPVPEGRFLRELRRPFFQARFVFTALLAIRRGQRPSPHLPCKKRL